MKSEVSPADGKKHEPIQLIEVGNDHKFTLNEESLKKILLQDDIKDRSVAIISVAGDLRKGKSFLLNFFLRYLYAKYRRRDASNWLSEKNKPLTGFSWRGGVKPDTTGILMWSDVFTHDYENGDKVAIILLDTQGAFDNKSTLRDCATIFGLSTLVSSVQCQNLSGKIQQNDLQFLNFFTEYGRLTLEDTNQTPFQRLQFIVRDWCYPYEYEYGSDGGELYLQQNFEMSPDQSDEMKTINKQIKSCFTEIGCVLMPHPGFKVASDPCFDGRLSDIENEFKLQLESVVPMLLAPENLIMKEVNGRKICAGELIQYIKSYLNIYNGDKIPVPKSILEATAEANYLSAINVCSRMYTREMEISSDTDGSFLVDSLLEDKHLREKNRALLEFDTYPKLGGRILFEKYKEQLEIELERIFGHFKRLNDIKIEHEHIEEIFRRFTKITFSSGGVLVGIAWGFQMGVETGFIFGITGAALGGIIGGIIGAAFGSDIRYIRPLVLRILRRILKK